MSEIWDELDLKKPPIVTVPVKDTAFVQRLRPVINAQLHWHTQHETEFAQQAALLSRLVARRKNSFRHMAGYREMLKINAALCRLLRVDLRRDLESFYGSLPDVALSDGDVHVELPTRNLLNFVLVRLVGVYRIHQRIRDCCIQAADYFAKMLRTNYFMDTNTLLLAVFAKLYRLSGLAGNKHADLYGRLLPHANSFPQHSSCQFLSEQIEFPKRLEKFRNADAGNALVSMEGERDSIAAKMVATTIKPMMPAVSKCRKQKVDIGVAISRAPKQEHIFAIEQLKSVNDVKKFILAENKSRKQMPKKCITKEILEHEWLGSVKLFERKFKTNEHEKALNVFRKFLKMKIY